MKQKTPEQQLAEYREKVLEEIDRWNYLNENGGSDPFWSDGCNMSLVRNHIIYFKQSIATICKENKLPLPVEYDSPTPPKVSNDYMARVNEIEENAEKSLIAYLKDKDYQYLVKNKDKLCEKDRKNISIDNVIGYAKGLQLFISENDLVSMRRHENTESYIESFRECRKKMEKLIDRDKPEKLGQMDIFDFIN